MEVPESEYKFRHGVKVQMRFADIDAFGHVNNTVYLQYMDLGKIQYITRTLGDSFDQRANALVIAKLETVFYNPTYYGENIEVLTRTDAIGEHSIVLVQRVVNTDTGQVKCECSTVMVGYDVKKASSMLILDSWRKAIGEFEKRVF